MLCNTAASAPGVGAAIVWSTVTFCRQHDILWTLLLRLTPLKSAVGTEQNTPDLSQQRAFPNWQKWGKLTPDEASSPVKGVS